MNANLNTLGILELSSIASGYRALDAMLKAASVRLVLSRTICSGKYLAVVTGDVGSVAASVEAGALQVPGTVIEQRVIARLHPAIFPALGQQGLVGPAGLKAIGVMETFSAATVVVAADAGVKAADVELLRLHLAMAMGGKGLAIFSGELADVQAATQAAALAAEGMVAGCVVIPSPHGQLMGEYL